MLSEKKVMKLNASLGNSQHELARVLAQLVVAHNVWALGIGFKLGIKNLCELILRDPEVDLHTLNWKSLTASFAAFHVFDSFSRDVMPNAFHPRPT